MTIEQRDRQLRKLDNLRRLLLSKTKDNESVEIGETYYNIYESEIEEIVPQIDWYFGEESLNNLDFSIVVPYIELYKNRETCIREYIEERQSRVNTLYAELMSAESKLEKAKRLK